MSAAVRGLDADARAQALALAKRAAKRAAPRGRARTEPPSIPTLRQNQKIGDLTDVRTMRGLRQMMQALGVGNPYFRLHDGHASTSSLVDGRDCLNFSSYDYLGLNADDRPGEAAATAIQRYGVSASASRMVAGDRAVHRALENMLARHYRAEAAQLFVSGHATNISVIAAMVGEGDIIVHDAFVHNSITAGARMSAAARRSFAHNDMDALEDLLAQSRDQFRNILVVVEGLYSMDGDLPDMVRLSQLKAQYGFWLMVDEAHALGCVGPTGLGSFEHFGLDAGIVDIWMGTLSKTLASTGGYIAGSGDLIDYLRYKADGFVYSVAMPPALAASAFSALEVMADEPERVRRLQANGAFFLDRAAALDLDAGSSAGFGVLPVVVGDSALALKLSERMFERRINVAPVTFPGVPMQSARLRFFLSAAHEQDEIDRALVTLRAEIDRLRDEGFADRIAEAMAAFARNGVT